MFIFPGCKNDAETPIKTINLHYKRIRNHFKFCARLNGFALFPTPTASRFQKNRLNCHKTISLRQPIKVAINLNRRWMCSSLKKLIFQFASVVSKTYLQRFIIRWLRCGGRKRYNASKAYKQVANIASKRCVWMLSTFQQLAPKLLSTADVKKCPSSRHHNKIRIWLADSSGWTGNLNVR